MKISSFDLNLFVIMNSIYTEGSLTKAAEVVGITQPAVSNALSRLREKFDDELFVRTGSGMVPTQKTENIIKDIQSALQLMQKSVNEPDEFNPETSQKTFRISLGDINEGRILAILMGKMEEQAPNVKLECYYTARDQVPHALATNELSFAVDPFIPNSKDTNSVKVFTDQFVIAHRANHPVTKVSEMNSLFSVLIPDTKSPEVIPVAQKIESPLTISSRKYFLFKSTIPNFLASLISFSLSNINLP